MSELEKTIKQFNTTKRGAIVIRSEIRPAVQMLEELGAKNNRNQMTKRVLTKVGQKVRAELRKSLGTHGVSNDTGNLKRNMIYRVLRNGSAVVVYSKASRDLGGGNTVRYPFTLASGYTVKETNKRMRIGDRWVSHRKEYRVNARNYVTPVAENWLNSPDFGPTVDAVLQREINRLQRKAEKEMAKYDR